MLLPIFFALSGIALLFFIVPLLRRPAQDESLSLEKVNTLVFRDKLADLDRDLADGKLDDSQYVQMKAELEATLLSDVRTELPGASQGRAPLWGIIAVGVAIPLISVVVYRLEGDLPKVDDWLETRARWEPALQRSLQGQSVDPEEVKDITAAEYIRVLQFILQGSPENVAGWQDLGMAYMQVGLYHFAEAAFSRASALLPKDTEMRLLVVESKLAQGRGGLDQEGEQLLREVLALEPGNPKARMMAGMVAFNRASYDEAIAIWRLLLADTPADSEGARILASTIERAEAKRAEASVAASADAGSAAGGAPRLQVEVSVADTIAAQVDGSWWLMVYAKAVNGLPMPVAIEKIPYTPGKRTVVLDDADAMAPMAKLSTSEQVRVYARLSRSGSASPQAGDFYVESPDIAVKSVTAPLQLNIDQAVN